jgi:hypothetical protein
LDKVFKWLDKNSNVQLVRVRQDFFALAIVSNFFFVNIILSNQMWFVRYQLYQWYQLSGPQVGSCKIYLLWKWPYSRYAQLENIFLRNIQNYNFGLLHTSSSSPCGGLLIFLNTPKECSFWSALASAPTSALAGAQQAIIFMWNQYSLCNIQYIIWNCFFPSYFTTSKQHRKLKFGMQSYFNPTKRNMKKKIQHWYIYFQN